MINAIARCFFTATPGQVYKSHRGTRHVHLQMRNNSNHSSVLLFLRTHIICLMSKMFHAFNQMEDRFFQQQTLDVRSRQTRR